MSTPKTPRTDEKIISAWGLKVVHVDVARKLETELNETKWQLHLAKGEVEKARKMERKGLV